MSEKVKKPLWKRWWVWVVAILIIGAVANAGSGNKPTTSTETTQKQGTPKQDAPKKEEPKKQEAPKNSPKMSKAEFDQIQNGMTYEEVVKIVGGPGEMVSETGSKGDPAYTVMYMWQGDGQIGANANAMFQGGKMMNKAQMGLK